MAQGKEYTKEERDRIIHEVLKPYFLLGQSVERACRNGKFPVSTFRDWLAEDEVLRREIESWQHYALSKAEETIVKKINEGDIDTAKWYAERKGKKEGYSNRVEITGEDGEKIEVMTTVTVAQSKAINDALTRALEEVMPTLENNET